LGICEAETAGRKNGEAAGKRIRSKREADEGEEAGEADEIAPRLMRERAKQPRLHLIN